MRTLEELFEPLTAAASKLMRDSAPAAVALINHAEQLEGRPEHQVAALLLAAVQVARRHAMHLSIGHVYAAIQLAREDDNG